MQLQDYKDAVFAYFQVKSLSELRAKQQWQNLAAQEGLTDLRSRKGWELAYTAVSRLTEKRSQASTSKAKTTKKQLKNISQSTSPADGSFHALHNHQDQLVGGLLEYSQNQSQQLIDHFKSLQLHSPQPWHQGNLGSAIVDQLGATSALVATGLQAGQLFRVVGPPALVKEVESGVYKLLQSTTGFTGTVIDADSGKIVGQLRFSSGKDSLPVLAPVAAYQILHAMFGVQQLNQIDQRLAKIEHILQELHVRQEASVLGQIHYAMNVLDDVLSSRMQTGIFSADSISRLALAEQTIVSTLERNRFLVERFREKFSKIKEKSGKQGARSTAELLKTDGGQAAHDMQCLVGLIAADLKLEQALLLLAVQNNPADVGRRQEKIHVKMQSYHQTVESLPSIKEMEAHTQTCLENMEWWEKLFDFGQTDQEVQAIKELNLQDVPTRLDTLQPSLDGYVFWQDQDGVHAFLMSGNDLKLTPAKGRKQKSSKQSST